MSDVLAAAEAVRAAHHREVLMATPLEVRVRRFNEQTGVSGYMSVNGPRGGNHHPDRCRCQGPPTPPEILATMTDMDLRRGIADKTKGGDTTPHKHYQRPPYACARCSCQAYVPHDWPDEEAHAA